jgi:hypothetical protein
MVFSVREDFNNAFKRERYDAFLRALEADLGEAPAFRVAETPVFIPQYLKSKLLRAVDDVIRVIAAPGFLEASEGAIPEHLRVPGETKHPHFIQLDFGICSDDQGLLTPMLIELQGFPSLYGYQHVLAQAYQRHFDLPEGYAHLPEGLGHQAYVGLLERIILGDEKPEHVVLLEIEPEQQNTRVDFWATRNMLGIPVVCLSKVEKDGRQLFYRNDYGQRVAIHRIYNRIIFDELERRADLPRQWNMVDPVDVQWTGHPNWFFRMSKHTLPSLKSEFVPETHFLDRLKHLPEDLHNWVLKPLFSFSGMGVKVDVTPDDINAISQPDQFILQRKVSYAPALRTPDPKESAKCEIRMMMVWDEQWPAPRLANNLVRLSKGAMVGVRYNHGKEWVGSSVAFFES